MKEEILDEIHIALTEIEKLLKLKIQQENYFFERTQLDNNFTIRDSIYQDIQIEKHEKKINQKTEKIIDLFQWNKGSLKKLVNENFFKEYGIEIYNLIINEIASRPFEWKEFIENEFIDAVDKFKIENDNIYYWERFTNLSENISRKSFNDKSSFYNKLISELESQNSCLVYWATMILWKKEYTNSRTIEAFSKNLNHKDWRIRVISHECLQTWVKEKRIDMKNLAGLSIKDKWKVKFNKHYESKLLAP